MRWEYRKTFSCASDGLAQVSDLYRSAEKAFQ